MMVQVVVVWHVQQVVIVRVDQLAQRNVKEEHIVVQVRFLVAIVHQEHIVEMEQEVVQVVHQDHIVVKDQVVA